MSPEQVDGLSYNEKSDVWALGCLTYELACLRPPFTGGNPLSLARSIKSGRFARVSSHYSSDLQKFINLMLVTQPHKRASIALLEKFPQIQMCHRESRLKYHYQVIKQREEEALQRERRLDARKLQLDAREKQLDQLASRIKLRQQQPHHHQQQQHKENVSQN